MLPSCVLIGLVHSNCCEGCVPPPAGFTYERDAIQSWLTKNRTSPMTGEQLADAHLVPNHTLMAAMRQVLGDGACSLRRQQ